MYIYDLISKLKILFFVIIYSGNHRNILNRTSGNYYPFFLAVYIRSSIRPNKAYDNDRVLSIPKSLECIK